MNNQPEWITDILRDWLKRAMSEISEDHMAAGWLDRLEYTLWDAVLQHPEPLWLGFTPIDQQRIERIKAVSEHLGEWVVWDWDQGVEKIVSMAEWLAMYRASEKSGDGS